MTGSSQSNGQLIWQELLSPKEIEEWAASRKKPRKLWRVDGVSRSGVYRFIFPKDKPPSCYIGIAGDFGRRLHDHICPRINQKPKDSEKVVSGWPIRGAIKNWLGKCHLQYLTIEGAVRVYGVILNQHDLDNIFVRLLLENWAILHSERSEKLRPLNHDIPTGIQQSTKDFLRLAKEIV